MANFNYTSSDLETLATATLLGPRGHRLLVLNTFRGVNGEDPVEYLVNVATLDRAAIDNAVDNLTNAAESAAPSGDFVGDSEDLETAFAAALVGDRLLRLRLLNVFRTAQGADPVEYLVNSSTPTWDALNDAIENVENA